jgi:CheY-like chemotaxis protein
MPDIDGYEISKRIRLLDNPKKRKIPIIALTAAATDSEIKKCYESGMNDYVVKPFKKEELIAKLLTLASNKKNELKKSDF